MQADPTSSPLAGHSPQVAAGLGEPDPSWRRRLSGVDAGRYAVYLGFVAIFIVFSITLSEDGFTSGRNLLNILEATAPITVMAVATAFVLGAGEVDFSLGAVVALSSLVAALVLRETDVAVLGALAGLGTGAAIGLLNGSMTTLLRLTSFLVTLGTMGLVTGLAQRITNLESVPSVNETFNDVFGSGEVLGVSTLILWSLAAVALGHYVLRHRRTGAHVLASGDNAAAAQVSGVRVRRVRIGVLVASGIAAAFAGLMYTANLHGATYSLGSTDLLTVVAAVVIGGTRLLGGRSTVIGALVGSLLLGVVNNGLILSGFSTSEQQIAQGVIILVAVALTLREPAR
ncbi:MAG: ABC transporter permease [Actinobacteria bacterium]|nr:ABC transporter permease [Actinomycetota bacterium]